MVECYSPLGPFRFPGRGRRTRPDSIHLSRISQSSSQQETAEELTSGTLTKIQRLVDFGVWRLPAVTVFSAKRRPRSGNPGRGLERTGYGCLLPTEEEGHARFDAKPLSVDLGFIRLCLTQHRYVDILAVGHEVDEAGFAEDAHIIRN